MDMNKIREEAIDFLKNGKTITEKNKLDKFQVTTCRLIDTIHGYFLGNHPATTIDNARAVCELISGLTKYLQKKGFIPRDFKLIYNIEADPNDSNACNYALSHVEMFNSSKAGSNYAKHSDRDADKTFLYENDYKLAHLLHAMVCDYGKLHLALIRSGRLDLHNEILYPVNLSDFSNYGGEYKELYIQEYFYRNPQPSLEAFLTQCSLSYVFAENLFSKEIINIPAAAVACMYFNKECFKTNFNGKARQTVAEEIRGIGIWPVETSANAKMNLTPKGNSEENNPIP